MSDLPFYVWALSLTGVLGIPAITCVMLFRGALAAGLARGSALRVTAAAAAVLGGWIVVSGTIAATGGYVSGPGGLPRAGFVLLGVFAAMLLATRIPVIARILAAPGTVTRLAVPQILRVTGGVFVLVLALGELPALFALPAGLGDVLVGITALLAVRALAAGNGLAAARNLQVFGLLDLAIAVGLGVAIGTGVLAATPGIEVTALLPLALVPTTAVPLVATLHIVSLRRLRAASRTGDAPVAGGVAIPA